MRTLRRQARPSASWVEAPKARASVGSSTRVTRGQATSSPIRPAKIDRPFVTASPDSAEEMIDSNVDVTRESSTTTQRPDLTLLAPIMRVARSMASVAASSESTSPGPRPALNPTPVWLSAPSPAMADTDRLQIVRRAVAVIPVEVAMAASAAMSP